MNDFEKISPADLRTAPPFKGLMPHDKKVVSRLEKTMRKNGFDPAFPIVVWKGHGNLVVDGHLRLAAALKARIKMVWICEHEFSSGDEAVAYAIHHNIARGSYTAGEIRERLESVQYDLLAERVRDFAGKIRITSVEVTL